MSLADIVNVQVSANATGVARTGFGVLLIVDYHAHWADRVRFYTSIAAMVADGFSATSQAVLAATAAFSQSPRPRRIAVGRRTGAPTTLFVVTPTAVNSATYTVTLNGTAFSMTADASATAAEIVTGLIAAINAGSVPVTASGTSTLILTADVAGDIFTLELGANLARSETTVDPATSLSTDLASIALEDNSWYGFVLTSKGKAEALLAAAYAEANTKLFGCCSADSDIITSSTTDLFSALETAGYARTIPIYVEKPQQHADAAWFGRMLPLDPGSATWKFKTLAGVDSIVLTETEIGFIQAKHGNWYVQVGGVNITQEGWTPAGEFVDVTVGSDWLTARLQERVFGQLVNRDKIPFTDQGVALIVSEVFAQLEEGIAAGFLSADPKPVVTAPLVADVSSTDRAARLLPDVTFSATLAGAIHSTEITGTISA